MEELQKAKSLLSTTSAAEVTGRVLRVARRSYDDLLGDGCVNRHIFTAMLTVGTLTLVVKVVSTFKEMAVARAFGTSDSLDALLMAYLLPSFGINVIAGSLNAALIPTYIQVRDCESREAAQRLLATTMLWSLVLLTAIAAIIGASASKLLPLLASGFTQEKLELTRYLMFMLLPTLPLTGLFVIWAAVLNAGERFMLAAISPVTTPLVVIFIIRWQGEAWGIRAVAFAMITGTILEGLLLATALSKRGISILPRWYGFTPHTRQVLRQYAPMIAGSSIMSSTGLVDQSMAAMLGPGSVSMLNYGNKISAVVVSLGAMAVSTAVLPQFSRMAAARDWSGVRQTVSTYTRLLLMTTIPLTVLLVFASRFLVSLLFERGAFTASDTVTVSAVQSFYVLQLPFFVTGMLFVRLTSALKANYLLMWGSCLSFILNIVLDYVLMRWLGVPGIALSTTFVYLAALGYLSFIAMGALKRAEQTE